MNILDYVDCQGIILDEYSGLCWRSGKYLGWIFWTMLTVREISWMNILDYADCQGNILKEYSGLCSLSGKYVEWIKYFGLCWLSGKYFEWIFWTMLTVREIYWTYKIFWTKLAGKYVEWIFWTMLAEKKILLVTHEETCPKDWLCVCEGAVSQTDFFILDLKENSHEMGRWKDKNSLRQRICKRKEIKQTKLSLIIEETLPKLYVVVRRAVFIRLPSWSSGFQHKIATNEEHLVNTRSDY